MDYLEPSGLPQFFAEDKTTFHGDITPAFATQNERGMYKTIYDPPEAGQTKGLVELAGGISSALSYSEEETATGAKWIDGKPIYRKVVTVDTLGVADTWIEVPHGISNLNKVIRVYGTYHVKSTAATTRDAASIPNKDTSVNANTTGVVYYSTTDLTGSSGVFVIEYTKM